MNDKSNVPNIAAFIRELKLEQEQAPEFNFQAIFNQLIANRQQQIDTQNQPIEVRNDQIQYGSQQSQTKDQQNEVTTISLPVNPQVLQLFQNQQMTASIHLAQSQISSSPESSQASWNTGDTASILSNDPMFQSIDSQQTISSIYFDHEISIEEIYAPEDSPIYIDMYIRYMGNLHSYTYDWLCLSMIVAYRVRSISPIICSEQFDDIILNFHQDTCEQLDKDIEYVYQEFTENLNVYNLQQLLMQAALYNHMYWLFNSRGPQFSRYNRRRASKIHMDQLMLSLYWRQENQRKYEQNPLYPLVQ